VSELAGAALATQLLRISQLLEDWRFTVDGTKGLCPHVASRKWQKPTGEYLSEMRDEDKSFDIVQSPSSANRVLHFFRCTGDRWLPGSMLCDLLLQHIAPVMLRFRGLDVKSGAP